MRVVDISKFDDSVVLYFDTSNKTINAYTLASMLVSISDAAKAANTTLNTGYELEILVEALAPGSFKAKIFAVYTKTKNLFSSEVLKSIVLSLIASYIYDRTFALDESINVEIHTNEVIIQKGDEKIIVPRKVYEAAKDAEKNPKFIQAIEKTYQIIQTDNNVKGFTFAENMQDKPEIIIPRESFVTLASNTVSEEDEGTRVISETAELQILKAILEKGKRKWEFMWQGFRISAPITSEKFYKDFVAHDITIAPGDSLQVRLEIKQIKDEVNGIFKNDSYEVIEVYKHIPRLRQGKFDEKL